jgi:isoaspartyl peptidase/L-asparaginase-like protein (Ntn-hydrolase superfamily)
MDGGRQKFSAVALVTHLLHPSRLALALQDREQTMLGTLGRERFPALRPPSHIFSRLRAYFSARRLAGTARLNAQASIFLI